MTSSARGRPAAQFLLAALILAITIGPRIRLPGLLDRHVDLRVQDFILIPALLYVGRRVPRMRPVWGPWPLLFAVGAIVVTTLHLWMDPTMSILRTVAYLGRTLETFVLAAVVAGLYRLAADRALSTALSSLHIAVAANVSWVAFQYATGAQRTLLGSGVGDTIESYGPKLVGEASAFGTGFFFVLVAALGCAQLLTAAASRWVGLTLLVVAAAGAYVSQSRVSLGAVALCIVAVLFLPDAKGNRRVFSALVMAAAAVVIVPRLPEAGRLSEAGLEHGFSGRMGPIWDPLIEIFVQHPVLGIGTGQLGTATYPWTEAHNIALRAGLDYGLVVGGLFLAGYLAIGWRARRTAFAHDQDLATRLWAVLALLLIASVLLAGVAQDTLIAVMSTHLVMLATGLLAGARLGPLADPSLRLEGLRFPATLEASAIRG